MTEAETQHRMPARIWGRCMHLLRYTRSFTFGLTLVGMGILLAVMLLGQAGLARGITEEMQSEAAELLHAETRELSAALDQQPSSDYAQNLISAALTADRDGRLLIYFARIEPDKKETFLEGNMPVLPTLHPAKRGLVSFHLPADLPTAFHSESEGLGGKYLALALRHPKGYHMLLAYRMSHLQAVETRIGKRILAQSLLSLMLATLGSLLFTSVINRRLRSLNDTCRALTSGNLGARADTTGGNDEFDRLSQNFNQMLERIEHLVGSIRQTGDHLAHDMRTPLSRLRNTVAPLAEAEHEAGEIGQEALEQIDQLSSMLDAILLLARAEAGTLAIDRENLAIDPLLTDISEMFEPLAEASGHNVRCLPAPGEWHLLGQRQLLLLALSNLVDNAIKYTPEGSTITLRAEHGDHGFSLIVEDEGPGIPEHLREHAKQRFVQLDSSRHAGGAGIGMSFVTAVARLHGGQFVLGRVRPGDAMPGLRAELRLPAEI